MAIIPDGEKVLMTSADVNTIYGGSTALKELNKWYTIEDIAETIGGGGGGGLGSLKIEADGQIGNPVSMTVSIVLPVVDLIPGVVNTYDATGAINVQLSGSGGYGGGGAFTATTISFPDLAYAYGVNIGSTTTLQTLSFPDLVTLASSIYLSQNTALEAVSFPELVSCSTVDFSFMPNLVDIDFPSLVRAGNFGSNGDGGAFSYINGTQFPALRTVGFGGQGIYGIDLPALTTVTGFNFYASGIVAINLPGIVDFKQNYFGFDNKTSLTTFIVGTAGTIKSWGSINAGPSGPYSNPFVSFQNCSLNQASVDNILVAIASLDGTNGTTPAINGTLYLNGGSNATPSQVGLDAKTVLLNRGWNISNN